MRVAVIGLGTISASHINALLACGQEIVALCDILPERCESAKEKFGLDSLVYTDYHEMLREVKPDSIHIATPHYLHAPIACMALDMGINVLTEKPLAISYEQLSDLKRSLANSTATLGVCQQNRYNSAIKYAKKVFGDEKIHSAYGNLVWCRDEAYYESADWRGKWETEGGGVMINQALHTLDLLQWFCGMPDKVTANIFNTSLGGIIEVEDTASALFKVGDDARFVINATNSSLKSFPVSLTFASDNHKVDIIGDNIIVDGNFVTRSDGEPLYGKAVYGNGHVPLVSDFYDCIANGREFPLSLYEAEKVIRLILAMYESHGKEILVK